MAGVSHGDTIPSETDASVVAQPAFVPQVFIDLGEVLERKLAILEQYATEIGVLARSIETVRSQARYHGLSHGMEVAERFALLRAVY